MRSSNVTYIPELDHLRFFAALSIVIFHLANGPLVHFLHLDIGVPLFFTLSGYLFFTIANTKKTEEILYWKFLYNRVLRIYPLTVLLFLMTAVIMDTFTAIDFINLFGLNFPGKVRNSWAVGDWGYNYLSFNWWTIGVEFVFYAIFPLLFKTYRKIGVKFLINLLLFLILLKFFMYFGLLEEYGWKKLTICFNYSFFGNFDIFIIGMLIAYLNAETISNKLFVSVLSSKIIFLIYVVGMWGALIYFSDEIPLPLTTTFFALLCGLLILLYQHAFRTLRGTLFGNFLSALGKISFSTYLLHDFIKMGIKGMGIEEYVTPFLTSVLHYEQAYENFTLLLFYVPIILLVSKISFNVIELPFLNMRISYFKPCKQNGRPLPPYTQYPCNK